MRTTRLIALIIGCLMLLPGIGLLIGGGALGIAYAAGRNDSGYFQATLNGLHTSTDAITAQTPALTVDTQTPTWLINRLDTDLRLTVTTPANKSPAFIGIASAADVDAYLGNVAHDEIIGLGNGGTPVYRSTAGTLTVAPPTEQTFWAAKTSGPGTQQLSWRPTDGQWAVVIMNADGSPGISAPAIVEIRAGFLLPLALILLTAGLIITVAGSFLIVFGASRRRGDKPGDNWPPAATPALELQPSGLRRTGPATPNRPVVLDAHLDPGLSRWQWLVKWFLAIPHYFVLAFLWPAFFMVTIVAGFCILFTGRYPRALFDFTSGVLRWTWRVSYYSANGGIGTDQYPPFTLGAAPDYPATLDITYPERLSRPLVLVKWLLALPHLLIIGLLVNNWWGWTSAEGGHLGARPAGSGGLFGVLIVVTGIVLLITAKYPAPLFALIIGCNRWLYRVIAYVALMTDVYPPFRLDQGGPEPTSPPPLLPVGMPADPRAPAHR